MQYIMHGKELKKVVHLYQLRLTGLLDFQKGDFG